KLFPSNHLIIGALCRRRWSLQSNLCFTPKALATSINLCLRRSLATSINLRLRRSFWLLRSTCTYAEASGYFDQPVPAPKLLATSINLSLRLSFWLLRSTCPYAEASGYFDQPVLTPKA